MALHCRPVLACDDLTAMDDLQFGTRNKRGDWSPKEAIGINPIFSLPPNLMAIVKWLPGYFLPWNLAFMATAFIVWNWLLPSVETMKTLQPGWILYLLLLNSAAILLFYGALEFRLYWLRHQGNRFKYNAKWPAENKSDVFMFKSQIIDGIIRTFTSGVPIWTAYQVLVLWCYANGIGQWVSFADHPVWLCIFAFLVPIIHELHFYCIHRLIHVPILYKWIHSVHHNSVNPSPWSSLSMHPVEHLLYWSSALLHIVLPSHPVLALYQLHFAGFGAVVGHIGFDKIELGEDTAMATHAYAHYLHHKYFEVNYSDATIPLDKIFGTWHDGTKEAEERMNARFAKKIARMNKS